ncbi:MAG: ribose-phosphate pyrophosphokinase [Oscillospiraceae bacterium]|nr:ribose-phosphate pyrophosphokinase [Oscillospiraceae bacterium]
MIAHGKEIRVFTGNSNPALAQSICQELYMSLGNASVSQFADGECSISVFEPVRGKDVFIVQSTCKSPAREKKSESDNNFETVNDNLMELLIMIDAMRRASAGRITAVIPYFGYARQDRKAKSRDPISAKLVANLITAAGADRVLTMDLHAAQIQGFFDIPVDNLMGGNLFVKHYQRRFGKGNEDVMVVSPDVGSTARARAFSMKLGLNMAIVDKRRERANQSEVMNIIGNVEGKTCILLDDIVDTAGSLCGAAKAIKEIGGAREVYACATHGVLSGPAIERIQDSCIQELLFLDTIPYPADKPPCEKIQYLTTASVFAEAIRRIYEEVSIANMFEN